MNIALAADGPLDVDATLARYRLWGEDPAIRLGDGSFCRVLRVGETLIPYEVRWRGPVDDVRLRVRAPGTRRTVVRDAILAEVRKVFGLDFDLPGFYRFAKGDAVLSRLVESLY